MKKKSLFLSLVLMFSFLMFVGCDGKKSKTPSKQEPTVHARILNQTYYVGDELSSILIFTSDDDTDGVIEWVDDSQTLVLGDNTCRWKFIPTDETKYKNKTGQVKITAIEHAVDPNITVSVVSGTYYAETTLENVSLQYSPTTIAGTLAWKNKNTKLALGTHSYEWKFNPTESLKYNEITGTVSVTAVEQYLTKIEVEDQPKTTGYTAFDLFDDSDLSLKLTYNQGKTQEIDEGWTIVYENGNCLHADDEKVTISYGGKTCDIELGTIARYELELPTISGTFTYTGESQTISLDEDSELYTYQAATETDAGTYYIDVELVDSVNYKWKNLDEDTASIEFVIEKAELTVTENNYSGEYDATAHSVSVTAAGLTVYYSTEGAITEQNVGTTVAYSFTDATAQEIKVYYRVVSNNDNYEDKYGYLTVNISKQTPVLTAGYCYTIESESSAAINYPSALLTLKNKGLTQEIEFSSSDFTFTYYIEYDKTLTTTFNSGAEDDGCAPSRACSGNAYDVLVTYNGNGNYNQTTVVAKLYIDTKDNGFYAKGTEEKFAFKINPQVYGSTELCIGYVEFSLDFSQTLNLYEVNYISMFGNSPASQNSGKLTYENGYKLVDNSGNVYELSKTTVTNEQQEDETAINVTVNTATILLKKWTIPNYVKTFRAKTISDEVFSQAEQGTYETQYSTISIYNDHGTIRFELNYNLQKYEKPSGGVVGGSGTWYGVATYSLEHRTDIMDSQNPDKNGAFAVLTCYYVGDNYSYSLQSEAFQLIWKDATENMVEPTSVRITDDTRYIQVQISDFYEDLLVTFDAQ